MKGQQESMPRRRSGLAIGRILVVVAGIAVGQAALYGPSLAGKRILLPLDILAGPQVYLPRTTPEIRDVVPHDAVLVDLVCEFEPSRRFAVSELHAGRFPLWIDSEYAGSPFIWPKFSPFLLLECCTASPVILAWVQLLCTIVAGTGAYAFFRRVLGVGFWAAAITAWCYPLTGFFVFWLGFPTCAAVYWLPWLLLAVDTTVRRASLAGFVGLGAVTGLVLVSGHVDVGGQVLLTSGLYGVWRWFDCWGKQWRSARARQKALLLSAGWGLGLMLAAPHVWPLMEYAKTGARVAFRANGEEERPPTGLVALPEMIYPDFRGVTRSGHVRLSGGNQNESAGAIYAGVVATLFLAPLAGCSRRHRSTNLFWLLLILFAVSWCLNVPGVVTLLRLPGLKLMSHNRWVFAASFAILALAAVGLDTLLQGQVRWRWWFWLPIGVLGVFCGWFIGRAITLPGNFEAIYSLAMSQHQTTGSVPSEQLGQVAHWFGVSSALAAVWCGLGLACWLFLRLRPTWHPVALVGVAVIVSGDLLWFAWGRCAQCDPALYYPKIPALEQIAKAPPGRAVGYACLPALLGQAAGLRDIQGYDSIDPVRLMDLMGMARDTEFNYVLYALTQWYKPFMTHSAAGIRLSPILDMLNVRYVIFRGEPPPDAQPIFTSPDYWVMENTHALPRAFVPRRVEMVAGDREQLDRLAADGFDARETAYVETDLGLPETCEGSADIVSETPTRVTLHIKMQTAGLVVLGDLWDPGWHAYLDGKPVVIYRADHALRGVIAPLGDATLEFRYEPASLIWGLRLSGASLLILIVCGAAAVRNRQAPIQSAIS